MEFIRIVREKHFSTWIFNMWHVLKRANLQNTKYRRRGRGGCRLNEAREVRKVGWRPTLSDVFPPHCGWRPKQREVSASFNYLPPRRFSKEKIKIENEKKIWNCLELSWRTSMKTLPVECGSNKWTKSVTAWTRHKPKSRHVCQFTVLACGN